MHVTTLLFHKTKLATIPVQILHPPHCCTRSDHRADSPARETNDRSTLFWTAWNTTVNQVKTGPCKVVTITNQHYCAQLLDLMLLLRFDMLPEYMPKQWALTLVFQELLGNAHLAALLLPDHSGKCQGMCSSTECQEWKWPHWWVSVMTGSFKGHNLWDNQLLKAVFVCNVAMPIMPYYMV